MMALFKIFIDQYNRITDLPAYANPDERHVGDTELGFVVLDLTPEQEAKVIPGHSTLNSDNSITVDSDYVAPTDPSQQATSDPRDATIAQLTGSVGSLTKQVATLTVMVANAMKAGK